MAAPKIYLFLAPDIFNDPRGVALAEDGTVVWEWLYETREVAIGAMSGKLRQYREHFAAGYELVIAEADDLGFLEALRLNRAAWEAGAAERAAEHAAQMEAAQARYRSRADVSMDGGSDL